jgi:hypothetical protein
LYDTRYLSHSTYITSTKYFFLHRIPRYLATPYFTGKNVSIPLILRAFYGHPHRPRDEPALVLQPANTANIPDEDVPFHASRVLALSGSDLHNICSTPIFTPSAPIRPFSPLGARHPGGYYIYLLFYLRITLHDPLDTYPKLRYTASNPRCTNVELRL